MKFRRKDTVFDKLKALIKKGRTDYEISKQLKLTPRRVFVIRTEILKISNRNRKRKCVNCHKLKAINTFNFKVSAKNKKYYGWCIICRRLFGVDVYFRHKAYKPPKRTVYDLPLPVTKEMKCLKCGKKFKSEIVEQTKYKTVVISRLCSICQNINSVYYRHHDE